MGASGAAVNTGDHHQADRPLRPDEFFGEATPGKIGMWIFLLSDALMFAGLLLAYGILRGGAEVWHPPGQPVLGINFTAGLTFLLICSSVTMVLGYAAMVEGTGKRRPSSCSSRRSAGSCSCAASTTSTGGSGIQG